MAASQQGFRAPGPHALQEILWVRFHHVRRRRSGSPPHRKRFEGPPGGPGCPVAGRAGAGPRQRIRGPRAHRTQAPSGTGPALPGSRRTRTGPRPHRGARGPGQARRAVGADYMRVPSGVQIQPEAPWYSTVPTKTDSPCRVRLVETAAFSTPSQYTRVVTRLLDTPLAWNQRSPTA